MKLIAMLTTKSKAVPFVQTTLIGKPVSVIGTATKMSVVYAKINTIKKVDKMDKLQKLDEALKLLKSEYKSDIAYAMMYGYLAVMVDDKRANAVLELVKERVGK